MGQKLRGLLGQSLSGVRRKLALEMDTFGTGPQTWICPRSGFYRFVVWGAGAGPGGGFAGGSGAYVEKVAFILVGQQVAMSIAGIAANGASTVTLPNGTVLSAGAAPNSGSGAGGIASGGDFNINGSTGTAAGSGNPGGNGGGTAGGTGAADSGSGGAAGAPGRITRVGTFRGGNGASLGPGAGSTLAFGGPGLCIIVRQFDGVI
jgi:hypothetical protein